MNTKISIALFCTMSLFALSYLVASSTKSKGQKMLTIGQTLDLKNFTQDASGIKYQIVTPGKGRKPNLGETVSVHYTGYLLDGVDKVGKKFDSSKDRNQTFQFKLGRGQVIKGWDTSLADMHIGESRIVILPPNLAYGSQAVGNVIPRNATLIFEIDLIAAL